MTGRIATFGVAAILLGAAAPALGDAGQNASCIGIEASSISPPGSSDEFPGGMAELQAFLRSAFPGVPPGAIVSPVAHQHLMTHDRCDAGE